MKKIILILTLSFAVSISHAQKAFNEYHFEASDKLMNYKLILANGFHEGTTIQVINPRSNEVLNFVYDKIKSTDKIWVYNYVNNPNERFNFSFEIAAFDEVDKVPDGINAIYHIESEIMNVRFTRKLI